MHYPSDSQAPSPTPCAAQNLHSQQRQQLATELLAGHKTISGMACELGVSRKFLANEKDKANDALTKAFADEPPKDEKVLFQLPVTPSWIQQFVLALVLIGHSSYRGVQQILQQVLDQKMSLGQVASIVQNAAEKANAINQTIDLYSS